MIICFHRWVVSDDNKTRICAKCMKKQYKYLETIYGSPARPDMSWHKTELFEKWQTYEYEDEIPCNIITELPCY